MPDIKWKNTARSGGPLLTVMNDTQLASLANNGGAASASVTQQNAANLDRFADVELLVTFGTAPIADLSVNLFIRATLDGTNFEDASGARPPSNGAVAVFPLANVTTQQRIIARGIILPVWDFQWYLQNASGVAFPATGTTLRVLYYTEQVV